METAIVSSNSSSSSSANDSLATTAFSVLDSIDEEFKDTLNEKILLIKVFEESRILSH